MAREVTFRDLNTKSGVGDLPGLARIASNGMLRAANWTLTTSVHAGETMVRAAIDGQSPSKVVTSGRDDLLNSARQVFGLSAAPALFQQSREELRSRGTALLYRSADVGFDDDIHPAYQHILEELAADEARILRVLAVDGPQPAIDVRTGRPFGVGSALVAEGLTMLGEIAGCRHLDRVNPYLNNLNRLGLVWFSKETVHPDRYQVVEVQPVVTDAMREAGRAARTVRRSIRLTPFGKEFCRICLPLDGTDT